MRKRIEITEQTKENLITAYWDILDSEEDGAITVKEIADRAGYHRTTFYEYFTDVSDLKEQAEYLLIEKIQSQSNNILSNNSFDEYRGMNSFVMLSSSEVDFLLSEKDNLLVKYFLYIKHFCGKEQKQDFTIKQFLSYGLLTVFAAYPSGVLSGKLIALTRISLHKRLPDGVLAARIRPRGIKIGKARA